MVRRAAVALLVASGGLIASTGAARDASVPGPVVALLPLQDRAGDAAVVDAVEQALLRELGERSDRVVDPALSRSVLRRLRIRNGDQTSADLLARVAGELGADWLVSATVHDADRRGTPRLTLSARAYRGSTGELFWAGFEGGSGLDHRTVFDLGIASRIEQVAPRVVGRLTSDLGRTGAPTNDDGAAESLGTVALVPVGGLTDERQLATAQTVTEAVRAALYRKGVRLASPGCCAGIVRVRQGGTWGGVTDGTRVGLRETCAAEAIVTGSVEAYEVGGQLGEPEPTVAIALRMVDSVSGRIVWSDALERDGWDHETLFREGRVHSRGELTRRMADALAERLLRDRQRAAKRSGERR